MWFQLCFIKRIPWDKLTSISTMISTIILAGAAIFSVSIIRNQMNLMRDDSILEHRPYVFIDGNSPNNYVHYDPVDKNKLGFSFALANSGKSLGRNVELSITKTCLVKSEEPSQGDLDECKKDNEIKILQFKSFGKLSLYPGELLVQTGLNISKDGLQGSIPFLVEI